MKKFLSLVLVISLIFNILPKAVFAAPTDAELQEYLLEIGLTKDELIDYLEYSDEQLENFQDIEELSIFIGDVLTEENLLDLLDYYELTLEELEELLVENGEIEIGETVFDGFHFYDDLDNTLFYYLEYTFTPITDESLADLLSQYNLTYDELVDLFKSNDDSIEYYDSIEDLDYMIYMYTEFTPITDENLQELLTKYGLTYEELVALLEAYGDSLENYEYIEELDEMVDFYLNFDPEFDEIFEEIGLTEEELDNLFNHLLTLDYEDPTFETKLLDLSDRLENIGDFESADDLSPEQIAEIISIFNELLNLFKLDLKYYLVKGKEKKPLSFESLMSITTTNGYDLLIEIYNKQGSMLADVLLTAEMFGSEIIEDVGEDLKEVEEVVKEVVKAKPALAKENVKEKAKPSPKTTTVKGGKLPNTASDYPIKTLAGFLVIIFGAFLFRRWKKNYAA